jgi:hypothetical protein
MHTNPSKTQLIIAGTVLGAALGLVTAIMLARSAEEQGREVRITAGDMFKIALSLVGTMRGVATIGASA